MTFKNSSKKLIVVGNNTQDHVVVLGEELKRGEKLIGTSATTYSGGQAANVASTLSLMGVCVSYIGAFGDDEDGTASMKDLEAVGVDLTHSLVVGNCPSHSAYLFVEPLTGERTIAMVRDPRITLSNHRVSNRLLDDVAAVFLDGHEPEYSIELTQLANLRSIPVILDFETINKLTIQLLRSSTVVSAPSNVLRKFAESDCTMHGLQSILDQGPKVALATSGLEGIYGQIQGGKPFQVPAVKCHAIDTTGAGDAFLAGLLFAMLDGQSERECVEMGARVAAMKCTVNGPRLRQCHVMDLRKLCDRV